MNRSSFLAAASAGAFSLCGVDVNAADQRPTFAPDQLQSDMRALWTAMIEVGADPFRTSDRATLEAAYASTLAALDRPLTAGEFYVRTAALFAQLNDGHVDVFPGDALLYVQTGGTLFPLLLGIDDDGLYVREDTAAVPIGSRVVALDGRSEAQLLALALASVGAQTTALLRRRARSRLPIVLYELDGPQPTFNLTFRPTGGAARTVSLPAKVFSNAATTRAPYTFSTIANDKVGYIDYRQCVDADRFSAFLKDTFGAIAGNGLTSLVIDVRSNGGGNSQLNNELWQYASGKPFKQFGGFATRSSARLKHEYGQEKYTSIYGQDAWRAPSGKYLEYRGDPNSDLQEPGNNPLRFHGKTVLLIGTGTFSSAMACAVAAKDYGLATIVGEETGEPVVSTGEIYSVTAPATGLRCTFTTKVFFGPRPRPDRQGVIPDVEVVPSLADFRAGRDPVLDRGVAIATRPDPTH